MKKLILTMIIACGLFISNSNAQIKGDLLLKACVDSFSSDYEKDPRMGRILKNLYLKYGFDMENIAECGCKKLIKKYPEADYEVIDSLGDDEGMRLMRECTSDDFIWEMMETIFSEIGGSGFAICVIDALQDNISLDELEDKGKMEYYLEMYAGDCEKFYKGR
jgi:hypothetical protein